MTKFPKYNVPKNIRYNISEVLLHYEEFIHKVLETNSPEVEGNLWKQESGCVFVRLSDCCNAFLPFFGHVGAAY